jgi:hypothetical protein
VCVYSMVWRREKENDSRYTEGISPCNKTVYQICNIRYICNMLPREDERYRADRMQTSLCSGVHINIWLAHLSGEQRCPQIISKEVERMRVHSLLAPVAWERRGLTHNLCRGTCDRLRMKCDRMWLQTWTIVIICVQQ